MPAPVVTPLYGDARLSLPSDAAGPAPIIHPSAPYPNPSSTARLDPRPFIHRTTFTPTHPRRRAQTSPHEHPPRRPRARTSHSNPPYPANHHDPFRRLPHAETRIAITGRHSPTTRNPAGAAPSPKGPGQGHLHHPDRAPLRHSGPARPRPLSQSLTLLHLALAPRRAASDHPSLLPAARALARGSPWHRPGRPRSHPRPGGRPGHDRLRRPRGGKGRGHDRPPRRPANDVPSGHRLRAPRPADHGRSRTRRPRESGGLETPLRGVMPALGSATRRPLSEPTSAPGPGPHPAPALLALRPAHRARRRPPGPTPPWPSFRPAHGRAHRHRASQHYPHPPSSRSGSTTAARVAPAPHHNKKRASPGASTTASSCERVRSPPQARPSPPHPNLHQRGLRQPHGLHRPQIHPRDGRPAGWPHHPHRPRGRTKPPASPRDEDNPASATRRPALSPRHSDHRPRRPPRSPPPDRDRIPDPPQTPHTSATTQPPGRLAPQATTPRGRTSQERPSFPRMTAPSPQPTTRCRPPTLTEPPFPRACSPIQGCPSTSRSLRPNLLSKRPDSTDHALGCACRYAARNRSIETCV